MFVLGGQGSLLSQILTVATTLKKARLHPYFIKATIFSLQSFLNPKRMRAASALIWREVSISAESPSLKNMMWFVFHQKPLKSVQNILDMAILNPHHILWHCLITSLNLTKRRFQFVMPPMAITNYK
jgi:hypothetical protein